MKPQPDFSGRAEELYLALRSHDRAAGVARLTQVLIETFIAGRDEGTADLFCLQQMNPETAVGEALDEWLRKKELPPRRADPIETDAEVRERVLRGKPIPIRLHCPACGTLHIDEGDFATKPHHTHACQGCGMIWRPAKVDTVGVRFLPGYKNEPAAASPQQLADRQLGEAIAATYRSKS